MTGEYGQAGERVFASGEVVSALVQPLAERIPEEVRAVRHGQGVRGGARALGSGPFLGTARKAGSKFPICLQIFWGLHPRSKGRGSIEAST